MSEILANKLSPSTGTTVTLGDSGDTFNIPSGVTLTNNGTLNASAITAGTLPIARGGTGSASTTFVNLATNVTGSLPVGNLNGGTSASSSTFWRGDGAWAAAGGGLVKKVVQFTENVTYTSTVGGSYAQGPETGTFTMTNTNNKILVTASICAKGTQSGGGVCSFLGKIYRGNIASGTQLTGGPYPMWFIEDAGTEGYIITSFQYLDTPGANTTYSIGYRFHSADGAGIFGAYYDSNFIMQEIEV